MREDGTDDAGDGNDEQDADGEFRPDFGWGPLTFRGTLVLGMVVALVVIAAVVVGYVLLGSGAVVPGPAADDFSPNPEPDYVTWYVLYLPIAAVFALVFLFFAFVEMVLQREVEPFTRRYVFDFRAERAERGLIRAVLLGVLSALVPRR